jgi:hypothetical protein
VRAVIVRRSDKKGDASGVPEESRDIFEGSTSRWRVEDDDRVRTNDDRLRANYDRVRAISGRVATDDVRGSWLKFSCGVLRGADQLKNVPCRLIKFPDRIMKVASRLMGDVCELMKVAFGSLKSRASFEAPVRTSEDRVRVYCRQVTTHDGRGGLYFLPGRFLNFPWRLMIFNDDLMIHALRALRIARVPVVSIIPS